MVGTSCRFGYSFGGKKKGRKSTIYTWPLLETVLIAANNSKKINSIPLICYSNEKCNLTRIDSLISNQNDTDLREKSTTPDGGDFYFLHGILFSSTFDKCAVLFSSL
jgi:hypothetical protein